MNAIVAASPAMEFGHMERLADAIAKSNLFGIRTKEQALTLMAIAQAEGRHPALAARDYDVIQGRPSKKAEAMLRDFLEAGGKVEWHKLDDSEADATFHHPQGGKVRISWDMQRAAKAGLGGKDNWKKFPRQMLRSRTISEGVRTVWPMATSGLYEPGEVTDFAGPTIEAEPTRREQINAEVPIDKPKPTSWGDLLTSFELAIRDAQSADEIRHILQSPSMTEVKAHIGGTKPATQKRLDEILIAADERLTALTGDEEEAEIPFPEPAPA